MRTLEFRHVDSQNLRWNRLCGNHLPAVVPDSAFARTAVSLAPDSPGSSGGLCRDEPVAAAKRMGCGQARGR